MIWRSTQIALFSADVQVSPFAQAAPVPQSWYKERVSDERHERRIQSLTRAHCPAAFLENPAKQSREQTEFIQRAIPFSEGQAINPPLFYNVVRRAGNRKRMMAYQKAVELVESRQTRLTGSNTFYETISNQIGVETGDATGRSRPTASLTDGLNASSTSDLTNISDSPAIRRLQATHQLCPSQRTQRNPMRRPDEARGEENESTDIRNGVDNDASTVGVLEVSGTTDDVADAIRA